MSVQRWARKPEPPRELGLIAAQYHAGAPLDDLLAVLADAQPSFLTPPPAVTEVVIGGDKVLLVRWLRTYGDAAPDLEYLVVADGHWLCWSPVYDNLTDETTAGLEQWYTRAGGGR